MVMQDTGIDTKVFQAHSTRYDATSKVLGVHLSTE